jgi:hypothetical protein
MHQGKDEIVYIAQGQHDVALLAAAVGGVQVPAAEVFQLALVGVALRVLGDLVVKFR